MLAVDGARPDSPFERSSDHVLLETRQLRGPNRNWLPGNVIAWLPIVLNPHVRFGLRLRRALPSDVLDVYRRAFALGCKGITVYRHGAKAGQVLTAVRQSSVCPDCLSALEYSEGVMLCRACGFSSTS